MTALHSPGRWIGRSCHVENEAGEVIADVYAPTGDHSQRDANRDLIAAAPEFLAALVAIGRGLTQGQRDRGETPGTIARDTLDRLGFGL